MIELNESGLNRRLVAAVIATALAVKAPAALAVVGAPLGPEYRISSLPAGDAFP